MTAPAKLARFRYEVGAVHDTHARFFRIAWKLGGGSEIPTQGGECRR